MLERCYSPAESGYKNYGGRGITVCDRWRESFEAFLSDMGERPPGLSIDRIDNDGPYSPENCRWATAQQQSENRRSSQIVSLHGEEMTAASAARTLNLSGATLLAWAKRNGKSQQEAVDYYAKNGKEPRRPRKCV